MFTTKQRITNRLKASKSGCRSSAFIGAVCATTISLIGASAKADEADTESANNNRFEEVVVYGERVESTVSDTSISITAMDENFLLDMGIQGPNEMVNFIPATTRTDWDIKIRGIGRNFRGLGGDPGVGTYYNGIYSPDFGIASTEGGLYDIQRIEVLRGPQGTLYGRNSIGGVVNYVTNPANHDNFESQARVLMAQNNTREFYGYISGPVTENLAYRLVGTKRNSDGDIKAMGGAPDLEDTNDTSGALTLDWIISDTMKLNIRISDRASNRKGNFGAGGNGILSEGPCIPRNGGAGTTIKNLSQCDPKYRVSRDTSYYVPGLRVVDANDPAAKYPYVHPESGKTVWAAHLRPGVDEASYPYSPSPNYKDPWVAQYGTSDHKKPKLKSLTNDFVSEKFDHTAGSLIFDWDVSEDLSLKYLGSYQSFVYYFDRDMDFSSSKLSSSGDTVEEAVWSYSNELRIFWNAGERWTATSGLYYFREDRDQLYGIRNRYGKGFVTNPTKWGPKGNEDWVLKAVPWLPPCFDYKTATVGAPGGFGRHCGDDGNAHKQSNDVGAMYEHDNNVVSSNIALYTQGDYQISETVSVTLGLRFSRDWRRAREARGGYSEITGGTLASIQNALRDNAPEGFDKTQFDAEGVTPLAALNVALGAAVFTGDKNNPIKPVCDLTAESCDRPLRLGGIPINWGSRANGKYKTDNMSFRVNLNWEPEPNTLFYAGYTAGYRAGGFNMGGAENRATVGSRTELVFYKDEELDAYEMGYKGLLFDETLQMTASLYYYDYRNYQDHVSRWETTQSNIRLPAGVSPIPGRGPVEQTVNIPKAFNYGFEADATWLATEAFTLGGNFSYTISEYDTPFYIFNQNDPRYPRSILGGDVNQDPCTLTGAVKDLYCIRVKGVQLSGIPKQKATAWSSYRWEFSPGTLTWYASVSYTGAYFTNTFARPWDEVPARHRVDTRLSFDSADDTWGLSLFVDNVFNETFVRWSDMDNRLSGYGSNYPHRVVTLLPRFVGIEFTYNFTGS